MGYNRDKMAMLEKFSKAKYNSDEDLPEETQKAIADKKNYFDDVGADQIRKESWEKAGMFPKLKRAVKSSMYGDMHEKNEEQEAAQASELARRKRLFGQK